MPNEKLKIIHREDLYLEIEDLLGIKRSRHPRTGKGYDILNAIIKSITSALQRGEDIYIKGFGRFFIRTQPPRKRRVTYFYGKRDGAKLIEDFPEKRYVHFQPSKTITRVLNHAD